MPLRTIRAAWSLLCLVPPGNVAAGYVAWAGERFASGGPGGGLALPPLAPLAMTRARIGKAEALGLVRTLAAACPASQGNFRPGALVEAEGWLFQELGGLFPELSRIALAASGWYDGDKGVFPAGLGIFLGEARGEDESLPPLPELSFLAADFVLLRLVLGGPGLSALAWKEVARARRLKGRPEAVQYRT